MKKLLEKYLRQAQQKQAIQQVTGKLDQINKQQKQPFQKPENQFHYCLNPQCKDNHKSVNWFHPSCKMFHEKFLQITLEQALQFTQNQIQSIIEPLYFQIIENFNMIMETYQRGTECLLKRLQEKEAQSWLENVIKNGALNVNLGTQLQMGMGMEEKITEQPSKLENNFYDKIFENLEKLQKKKPQTNDLQSIQPQIPSDTQEIYSQLPQKKEIQQTETVIQEFFTKEEQAQYESQNPILKTIIRNICTDYEGSYTRQNLKNILSLFSKVYQKQKSSQRARQDLYEQEKKELKKYCFNSGKTYSNEMALLEWLQNKRGIKFDGQILPNAKNQLANTNYEKPNTCKISKDLVKSSMVDFQPEISYGVPMSYGGNIYKRTSPYEAVDKLIDIRIKTKKFEYFLKPMSQLKEGKIYQDNEHILKQMRDKRFQLAKKLIDLGNKRRWDNMEEIEKSIDEIKQPFYDTLWKQPQFFKTNRLWLFKKNLRNKSEQETGWVVDFNPEMSRYFWRANKQIDKYDVDNLLHFIVGKNSSYSDCPSIVINAGSHGDQKGIDAFSNKNKTQVDPSILYDMQFIIADLLQEIEKGQFDSYLTKQNIHQKIFINEVQHHRGGVYPEIADHIIDTYCNGAYSMIKKELIDDESKKVHYDLLFLSSESNLFIPSLFWYSNVLTTREEEKSLINLFDDGDKIDSVSLLYRQSIFGFSGPDQFHKFFYETDTIVICRTFKNKVIGAFTPIAHRSRKPSLQEGQTETKKMHLKDESGKSFIFTLSQDEKLRKLKLVKKQKAVYHQNNTLREICFGDYEFGTNTISQNSNIYCRVNKSAYFNENYQSFNEEQRQVKFCAEPHRQFSCKEWEVWKINFQKSQDKLMVRDF